MRVPIAKSDPAIKTHQTKSPDNPTHCNRDNREGKGMVGPPGVEPGTNGL